MELLNEMVSEPYHLLHFLAFFSYFVIRTSAAQILSPQITHPLFLREIQAALALGVFAAIKVSIYFFNFSLKSLLILFSSASFSLWQVVREETWEAFISDTLFFAKVQFLMENKAGNHYGNVCF